MSKPLPRLADSLVLRCKLPEGLTLAASPILCEARPVLHCPERLDTARSAISIGAAAIASRFGHKVLAKAWTIDRNWGSLQAMEKARRPWNFGDKGSFADAHCPRRARTNK
jgi:hypothetical protein